MNNSPEIFALGTALAVAMSNVLAEPVSKRSDPFSFNRVRLTAAFVFLVLIAILLQVPLGGLSAKAWLVFALSGAIGITLGDSAIYAAMGRVGAHVASLLYALNVPITFVFAALLLNEKPKGMAILGAVFTTAGVILVIVFRSRPEARSAGSIPLVRKIMSDAYLKGLGLGLAGAICQSAGVLMLRPMMRSGSDPLVASLIRIAAALLILRAMSLWQAGSGQSAGVLRSDLARTRLCGLLGMGLGMTLLLVSLQRGEAGLMVALASTTPVLVLLIQHGISRSRPSLGSVIGTLLACSGVFLILITPGFQNG